jgi:hypothetical protein
MPARAFVADAKSYTNTQTHADARRCVRARAAEWFILAVRTAEQRISPPDQRLYAPARPLSGLAVMRAAHRNNLFLLANYMADV